MSRRNPVALDRLESYLNWLADFMADHAPEFDSLLPIYERLEQEICTRRTKLDKLTKITNRAVHRSGDQHNLQNSIPRLLDVNDVKRLTSLGKTTIYQYVKDNKFPKPLRLGANKIRWREDEIAEWLRSLPRA